MTEKEISVTEELVYKMATGSGRSITKLIHKTGSETLEIKEMQVGVPQGSLLAPTLYVVYTRTIFQNQ